MSIQANIWDMNSSSSSSLTPSMFLYTYSVSLVNACLNWTAYYTVFVYTSWQPECHKIKILLYWYRLIIFLFLFCYYYSFFILFFTLTFLNVYFILFLITISYIAACIVWVHILFKPVLTLHEMYLIHMLLSLVS